MNMPAFTFAIAFGALFAPAANAALVTIGKDEGPITIDCYSCSWDSWDMIQNGFTAQTSIAYFDGDAFLYLHDDSGITESVFASVDGYRFDAVGANAWAYSHVYQTASTPRPAGEYGDADFDAWVNGSKPAYGNVGWYGYRSGTLVTSLVYHHDTAYSFNSFSDMTFGSTFQDLDVLVLRSLVPAGTLDYSYTGDQLTIPNTLWCDEWCAGIRLMNLTLNVHAPSAVPLPAAFGPLLLVLGGLGLAARRKRRAA
ncbi:hypothetical protein [Phaeovulum sp.]|uniref:hypothetical protein n=1 Tax=Phaeovulum sp. TaxID=2934796 RepID=UPI0039E69FF7